MIANSKTIVVIHGLFRRLSPAGIYRANGMRVARSAPINPAGEAHPHGAGQDGQEKPDGDEEGGRIESAVSHPAVDDGDEREHQAEMDGGGG